MEKDIASVLVDLGPEIWKRTFPDLPIFLDKRKKASKPKPLVVNLNAAEKISRDQMLVTTIYRKPLNKLFERLKWACPPPITLEKIPDRVQKFYFFAYLLNSNSFFIKRRILFLKRFEGRTLGRHNITTNVVEICPVNAWNSAHTCRLLEADGCYARLIQFTLAHELGHAWLQAQKEWSHANLLIVRLLSKVACVYKRTLTDWKRSLIVTAGVLIAIYFSHTVRAAFNTGALGAGALILLLIGFDGILLPVIQEIKADRFAEQLIQNHGDLLTQCIVSHRENSALDDNV